MISGNIDLFIPQLTEDFPVAELQKFIECASVANVYLLCSGDAPVGLPSGVTPVCVKSFHSTATFVQMATLATSPFALYFSKGIPFVEPVAIEKFCDAVPATAAIARTSVAVKSGGETRLVSIIHAITLILSMFLLGPVMSRIPLSALAGVLMVTAWRMNEWESIREIFKGKFRTETAQFLITMLATVVFDLTVAIIIGVVFSMLMFIIKSCNLSVSVSNVDRDKTEAKGIVGSYKHTKIVYLSGPMFFGTQDRLTEALSEIETDTMDVIFSMRGVPSIDSSAVMELAEIYNDFTGKGIRVLFCGVNEKVMRVLRSTEFAEKVGEENFHWDAVEAIRVIEKEVFVNE